MDNYDDNAHQMGHRQFYPSSADQPLLLLLGKLDGKMDSVLQRMDYNDKHHDELEMRITSLEGSRAYIIGIAAVVPSLLAIFATKIVSFLTGV